MKIRKEGNIKIVKQTKEGRKGKMSKNKKFQKALKKERGITLIALVITIIILIILATIAIRGAVGDNGLVGWAKEARDKTKQGEEEEDQAMSDLDAYIEEQTADAGGDSNAPSTVTDAKTNSYVFKSKTPVKDEKNNIIMVPAGFKIASDSGNTVQQGIVIEDVSASNDVNVQGSQYVWIPVGTFTKDDGSTSEEIILGRYTFDTSGNPTLQQDAVNYTQSVIIESYFAELSTYREGVASSGTDGRNATAKDLKGFIDSVSSNGGYYIGRYEASYASGSSTANYKAASKVSTAKSTSSMSYNPGTLWIKITQLEASKVAINTYAGSSSVKSDLMNSYAWDTAIVYIQEAGNTNYANQTSKNSNLANTGANGDKVCNINDMASNISEWTTEYSSFTDSIAYPCSIRGGIYHDSVSFTAFRNFSHATYSDDLIGFRLSLYL